uniref:Uncharacterized protein n=1 Tax=Arundo donax TaxID=35708 RepID=A0A0A9FWM7_ARUDO
MYRSLRTCFVRYRVHISTNKEEGLGFQFQLNTHAQR